MADLFPITLHDEIMEVEREVAMRERMYPYWVQQRKLRQDIADKQLQAMTAVLARLRRIEKEGER